MTRPKRWFLAEDDDGAVVVKNNEGLVKKPNAIRPLGKILTVSLAVELFAHSNCPAFILKVTNADPEKYSEDPVEVKTISYK